MMRTVQEIEQDAWDRQIEEDIATGKLDAFADAAIADHQAERTKSYSPASQECRSD